jgi:hypothetical protein
MGTSHFANLDNSDRLQKLLMALSDGAEHTTLELIKDTGLCAINSGISELRFNMIPITCRCITKGVYSYQLTEFSDYSKELNK